MVIKQKHCLCSYRRVDYAKLIDDQIAETGPDTIRRCGSREHTQKATSKQGETRECSFQSGSGDVWFRLFVVPFQLWSCCAQPILCFPMDIMFILYFFVIHFRSCIHISEKAWLCGSQKGCSLLPTQVEDQECLSPILMLLEAFLLLYLHLATSHLHPLLPPSLRHREGGEEKLVSLRYWEKSEPYGSIISI